MNNENSKISMSVDESEVDLSPITYLSRDLRGTKLSVTPHAGIRGRRLSMSNLNPDSPTCAMVEKENLENSLGAMKPLFGLSKNVSRLSCSKTGLMRRMNSAPVTSTVTTGQLGNDTGVNLTLTPLRVRTPLEDCDQNSQDSGYSADDGATFRFTEPNGFPPRKSYVEPSPRKQQRSPSSKRSFSDAKGRTFSFSSTDSFDDGFLDLADFGKTVQDENSPVPVNLGNLLTGTLISTDTQASNCDKRTTLRRAFSLIDQSPYTTKARAALFTDDANSLSTPPPFKRPRDAENALSSKRRKSNSLKAISENAWTASPRYKLQRSVSDPTSVDSIQLHKSISSTELIGDYSRPYALPVITGLHEDLKSITSDTLAGLLNGEFRERVKEFKIIDCRYPYEYEGGHINGARNLYTQEQIHKTFIEEQDGEQNDDDRRKILIFHCEFSKERGPNLYRYLRRCDRKQNSYPNLNYPEIYLLHGGYKAFFAEQKPHCDPCSYQPMVDPKHESDLKRFRFSKSNSWSSSSSAASFKRLAL